jgi:hypothetical protein
VNGYAKDESSREALTAAYIQSIRNRLYDAATLGVSHTIGGLPWQQAWYARQLVTPEQAALLPPHIEAFNTRRDAS